MRGVYVMNFMFMFKVEICKHSTVKTAEGRDFPGGPVVEICLPMLGVRVLSLAGRGIPHALRPKGQNIKQKQCRNKFNKDFKK